MSPWLALRIVGTIAIFAFIFTQLPARELWAAMLRTGAALWALSVLLHLTGHVIVAQKWRMLLGACGVAISRLDALRAHGAALFANICLPSIIGGDAIRLGIVVRAGGRLSAALTGGLADRVTDVVALISLAALGGLALPGGLGGVAVDILSYASLAVLVGLLSGLVIATRIDPERAPGPLRKALRGAQEALQKLAAQPGVSLRAFLVSLAIQGFFVMQNVWIGRAIGIDVPVAAWFVVWPLAKLVALTPVSLGGLGVREGALAALFVPFGVAPTLAVAESLVWQSVMIALGLIAGGVSWWSGESIVAASDPRELPAAQAQAGGGH